MLEESSVLNYQLRDTCKAVGARWAAWLSRPEKDWELSLSSQLGKARIGILKDFIQQPDTLTWLAGSLTNGRVRSRQTGSYADSLDCRRVYVFPNPQAQALIIVGVHQLEKMAQSFFRVLALQPPHKDTILQTMNAQRYQELASLNRELRKSIEAQQVAEMRLIRSARLAAVGELAAGVAHELNNPLTTIVGFVELVLEETHLDSPQYADLSLVLREAKRARGVVRNLLDFSRQTENINVPTDLNELVQDVLSLVQHLIKSTGVQLLLKLNADVPLVEVDPNQIKQVFLNLVHNALQAMPYGGILTLHSARQAYDGQSGVIISVSDTGEGIPEEIRDRIFEPFFTTRTAGKGTGLGLSVSYGIITSHGGTIEVANQIDQGSCFTVWLPVGGYRHHG